jgi:hypothetical protein
LYNLGGVQGSHFRPWCHVEIESDAHLLATDAKTAFTAVSFSALLKVTNMAPAA